ncbi:hypothetical protein OIU77_012942 [Salix suchowensis]|uniref:SHSP domain-containing protein n=1 Tax=Salix suchowensis TaxID=1278906 RepID=A0ABQ9A5F5_9ROSI|nr:hypothetical protein OIU77_012942 [Salix suchowensis]
MFNPRGAGYTGFRPRGYNPIRGQPVRSTFQSLPTNFQPKTEWKEERCSSSFTCISSWFLERASKGYGRGTDKMKAEFANGILTIRIPKNIPAVKNTDTGEVEATASQEDPGVQEFTGKPKPEKNGEENPSGDNLSHPCQRNKRERC